MPRHSRKRQSDDGDDRDGGDYCGDSDDCGGDDGTSAPMNVRNGPSPLRRPDMTISPPV
ncbi:hypothetical protein KMT30_31870 [Streptomyces sp. IBSBF 2953]|uniref:hypothetical protein n=1 Tax=Streptomyces TaxID=1883 RepID=UPI00211A4892|nr:hypothetical protein [Streptomyces scabiei]MCQ9183566.1 hypothetical protein [Streptomyces hayashii]MDX3116221.1 hypothetical protein [Streptomyces scabiei]